MLLSHFSMGPPRDTYSPAGAKPSRADSVRRFTCSSYKCNEPMSMLRAANSNTDFRQQKRGGRVVLTSSKLLIGIAGRLTGLMRETTYRYSPRQPANPADRNKNKGVMPGP